MKDIYVLDTSVVVKWFSSRDEKDTEKALKLRSEYFNGTITFVIPEILYYELANALRYNPTFNSKDVTLAVESMFKLGIETRKINFELVKNAVGLAYRFNITFYDAYFLALARKLEAFLITADYSFFKKLREIALVRKLSDIILK
jgi:predicted nucleic acid-binding protein